jgi:hypothetical protein
MQYEHEEYNLACTIHTVDKGRPNISIFCLSFGLMCLPLKGDLGIKQFRALPRQSNSLLSI